MSMVIGIVISGAVALVSLIIWVYIWAIQEVRNFKNKYKCLDGISINNELKELKEISTRL